MAGMLGLPGGQQLIKRLGGLADPARPGVDNPVLMDDEIHRRVTGRAVDMVAAQLQCRQIDVQLIGHVAYPSSTLLEKSISGRSNRPTRQFRNEAQLNN